MISVVDYDVRTDLVQYILSECDFYYDFDLARRFFKGHFLVGRLVELIRCATAGEFDLDFGEQSFGSPGVLITVKSFGRPSFHLIVRGKEIMFDGCLCDVPPVDVLSVVKEWRAHWPDYLRSSELSEAERRLASAFKSRNLGLKYLEAHMGQALAQCGVENNMKILPYCDMVDWVGLSVSKRGDSQSHYYLYFSSEMRSEESLAPLASFMVDLHFALRGDPGCEGGDAPGYSCYMRMGEGASFHLSRGRSVGVGFSLSPTGLHIACSTASRSILLNFINVARDLLLSPKYQHLR